MSYIGKLLLCAVIGYFVGSVNPSYLVARRHGFDIRESGSGNAGGSNAFITMGKAVGAFCCLFDILKAFFVIKLCVYLFGNNIYVYPITATACILGHIFPLFMHFKGGKGLACLGGSILAYSPKLFLVILTIEIILALIVNYLCVVPITASIAFPIVYGILEYTVLGALFLLPVTIVMLYKHSENLRRINHGVELHLSYLWKKDEEQNRINKNINKITESELDDVWHK